MAEVLSDTYGLMIYQESMLRVAQRFAGYTLVEAETLRRAAGKKVREIMAPGAREVRRRLRDDRLRQRHRYGHLRHNRALRRLCLRQEPRLRLRPGLVLDRLAESQPPGRVHGLPAHQCQGRQGQDGRLPGRMPVHGHRGPGPGHQPVGLGLHRRARRAWAPRSRAPAEDTPGWGSSRSGCRPSATSVRASSSGSWSSARRPARSTTSTTSATGSTPWCSTSAPSSR